MDKLTQEQWEYEFRKQYPEPDLSLDAEEVRNSFSAACGAAIKASYKGDRNLPWMSKNPMVTNGTSRAWLRWHDQCLSRFEALYEQDRWRAVMALNNGDLLID